jgi:hypothetical protein
MTNNHAAQVGRISPDAPMGPGARVRLNVPGAWHAGQTGYVISLREGGSIVTVQYPYAGMVTAPTSVAELV